MNHDSAPPGEQASRHSAAQMMTIRADTHTFMDLETFAQGVCAVLSMDLSQMSKTARQAVANRNALGLNCNSDALFTSEGYTANRKIQYPFFFFFFYVDNLCHLEYRILLNDSMNI